MRLRHVLGAKNQERLAYEGSPIDPTMKVRNLMVGL